MSIGENVKKRLAEKNATQTELAQFCAVSPVMITKIIYGKMPSVQLLARMAEFFGCTTDELLH